MQGLSRQLTCTYLADILATSTTKDIIFCMYGKVYTKAASAKSFMDKFIAEHVQYQ